MRQQKLNLDRRRRVILLILAELQHQEATALTQSVLHHVLKDDTEDVPVKSSKALALDVSICAIEFISSTDIVKKNYVYVDVAAEGPRSRVFLHVG